MLAGCDLYNLSISAIDDTYSSRSSTGPKPVGYTAELGTCWSRRLQRVKNNLRRARSGFLRGHTWTASIPSSGMLWNAGYLWIGPLVGKRHG